MHESERFIRGARRLPYELRLTIATLYLTWQIGEILQASSQFSISQTQNGRPTHVVLKKKDDVLPWISAVIHYFAHRTPRCRPNPSPDVLDQNTRFWVVDSPFRSLHTLDVTLTGNFLQQDMTSSEVGDLGRHLRWIPLKRLILRVAVANPLANGVVQWPRLPSIEHVELDFTRGSHPDEWKRPYFRFVFRTFTRMETLKIRTERTGNRGSRMIDPHPLFSTYVRGVRYFPKKKGEAPSDTLTRVAWNVSFICPRFEKITWTEREHVHAGVPLHVKTLSFKLNWISLKWV